jgi:hypothetical protein
MLHGLSIIIMINHVSQNTIYYTTTRVKPTPISQTNTLHTQHYKQWAVCCGCLTYTTIFPLYRCQFYCWGRKEHPEIITPPTFHKSLINFKLQWVHIVMCDDGKFTILVLHAVKTTYTYQLMYWMLVIKLSTCTKLLFVD